VTFQRAHWRLEEDRHREDGRRRLRPRDLEACGGRLSRAGLFLGSAIGRPASRGRSRSSCLTALVREANGWRRRYGRRQPLNQLVDPMRPALALASAP
jgi:hypothetical protein